MSDNYSVAQPHGAADDGHHGSTPAADVRYLAITLTLIGAFMIGELIAAFLAGSIALLADAGHMLTDVGALAASIWASRLSARPAAGIWTFGLKRAEVLSAAVNGVTLAAIGLVIMVEAITRLIHPARVDGLVVLLVAVAGAVVNIAATWVLAKANRSRLNVRGAFAHILTDVYAFIGTAVAGLVIVFTGFRRADSIASLIVVVLMASAARGLLRDSGRILLEATPDGFDLVSVRSHLLEVEHILAVHDLHAWTVTSGEPSLSVHVVVENHCFDTGHAPQLLDELQRCLREHFGVEHATFQLEPGSHAAHELGGHS